MHLSDERYRFFDRADGVVYGHKPNDSLICFVSLAASVGCSCILKAKFWKEPGMILLRSVWLGYSLAKELLNRLRFQRRSDNCLRLSAGGRQHVLIRVNAPVYVRNPCDIQFQARDVVHQVYC